MSNYLQNIITEHNKRIIALERRIQQLEAIAMTIKVEEINDIHMNVLRSMPLNKPVTRKEICFLEGIAERTQRKHMHCLICNGFVEKISDCRGTMYMKIKDIDYSSYEPQTHRTQTPNHEKSGVA